MSNSLGSCPQNSPGHNTRVSSLSLLQGIFPTQGSNPGLPHCKWILYQMSHKGSLSTRVGSLFFLQRIFPTQESIWDRLHCRWILYQLSYQGSPVVKNLPANSGDLGLIPGLGRSPAGQHGNPLQYSCLENPMDRGDWWATVHRAANSRTGLKRLSTHASTGHLSLNLLHRLAGRIKSITS